MSEEKERFLDVMKKIKEDIDVFDKIDLTGLYDVEEKEYSKVITSLENMLTRYEEHEKEISDIFNKPKTKLIIRND
ncbi:hypothetical protein [Nitrosopumilus sp.]|uniref:hypothetical protein n=1 Tax=Nitrosopumilus sp. TaxID=2024843 RepID=UPI00260FBD48|nr:hypothetical protein [Nitrosopumilus sp.]